MRERFLQLVDLLRCLYPVEYTILDKTALFRDDAPEDFLLEYLRRRGRGAVSEAPVVLDAPGGLCWLWAEDAGTGYIVGPMLQYPLTEAEMAKVSRDSRISQRTLRRLAAGAPVVEMRALLKYAVLLYYTVHAVRREVTDVKWERIQEGHPLLDGREESENNLYRCWASEKVLCEIIRTGNVVRAMPAIWAAHDIVLRKVYSRGELRSQKDLSLFFLGLCNHAAIEGGLSLAVAYSLQAHYTEQIEAVRQTEQIAAVNLSMYKSYVQYVHNHRTRLAGHSGFLLELQDYITLNLKRKLTAEILADEFGYTPYYLTRKFKEEAGVSLSRYIKEKRLEQAKHDLINSRLSVGDIAEDLQFGSFSYFCREFKRAYGCTPSEFSVRGAARTAPENP